EYLDPDLQRARPRIWAFQSSLYGAEAIDFGPDLDGYIYALDAEVDPPQVSPAADRLLLVAPFGRLEAEIRDRPTYRRWTLYGNIRLETLRSDFPGSEGRLGLEALATEAPGEAKLGVSFEPLQASRDMLINPKLNLLFPHVEVAWPRPEVKEVADRDALVRM